MSMEGHYPKEAIKDINFFHKNFRKICEWVTQAEKRM